MMMNQVKDLNCETMVRRCALIRSKQNLAQTPGAFGWCVFTGRGATLALAHKVR